MDHKKLFMGNLDFAVTEEEVKTLLSDYGTVVNIKMRSKKGCAFIEMSDEAEAALAIEKLNGIMFKDREVRIGPEMKASKAKAVSISNYNKNNATLSGAVKKRTYSRRPADSRHPQRKEWSHDKPARQNRTPRDGHRPGHGESPEPEINYNSRERFPDSVAIPSRSFSRGSSDTRHPQRKEWSHDRPARQHGTPRDGRRSGHGGSPRHETNYNSRERFPDSDERPPRYFSRGKSDSHHPQRNAWSHDRPGRPDRPSGPPRQRGDRTRVDSRPKTSGGSPNRFSPTSGPKPGSRGIHDPSHSPRPKVRGNAGNRGRNTRPKSGRDKN